MVEPSVSVTGDRPTSGSISGERVQDHITRPLLAEAPSHGQSVLDFAPASRGAYAHDAGRELQGLLRGGIMADEDGRGSGISAPEQGGGRAGRRRARSSSCRWTCPSNHQPRKHFIPRRSRNSRADHRPHLQPVVVRRSGEAYELVAAPLAGGQDGDSPPSRPWCATSRPSASSRRRSSRASSAPTSTPWRRPRPTRSSWTSSFTQQDSERVGRTAPRWQHPEALELRRGQGGPGEGHGDHGARRRSWRSTTTPSASRSAGGSNWRLVRQVETCWEGAPATTSPSRSPRRPRSCLPRRGPRRSPQT